MAFRAYRFIPEVEALRGIAAVAVVFEHTVGGQGFPLGLLHTIFNGQGAVILFFVMSGFALATQIANERPGWVSYVGFVTRRLFRLMPLVWVSLCLAYLVKALGPQPLRYDEIEIPANFLLLRFWLNSPLWSLYVELWCSFAFPLLFWSWRRTGIGGKVILSCALLVPMVALPSSRTPFMPLEWSRYLFCFCLGLAAAEYRGYLARIPKWPIALAVVVIAGSISQWTSDPAAILLVQALSYSALLATILCASDDATPTFLTLRPLKLAGVISFSVYLLHWPLRDAILPTIRHNFPLDYVETALFFSVLVVTMLAAFVTFKAVEAPCNQLGRTLARRLTNVCDGAALNAR